MFDSLGPEITKYFNVENFRWKTSATPEIKARYLRILADQTVAATQRFIEGKRQVKPRVFYDQDTERWLTKDEALASVAEIYETWIHKQLISNALRIPNGFTYHCCVNCGRDATFNMFTALDGQPIARLFYFDVDDEESLHQLRTYQGHEGVSDIALASKGLCRGCNTLCRVCDAKPPTKYNHKVMRRWFEHRTCPTCLGVLPTMFEFPKVSRTEWRTLAGRKK